MWLGYRRRWISDDALITLEEQQITILPAGITPGRPAELLGTTAMRRTIEALRSRFDRVVVHSAKGREVLAVLGVDATVIPHPVFPSDPPRADDGHTLLCLGTIRPYKGLGDAIAAAKRIDGARLLVAGDPLEPVNGYREEGISPPDSAASAKDSVPGPD